MNKKIQYYRAKWYAFKTNRFYMPSIRTGAKHGLIANIVYLFLLNPIIWISFGYLYDSQDQFISLGLIIFSTSLVFAAVTLPVFIFLGAGFGLLLAKSLEKNLIDWGKNKFIFKSFSFAFIIGITFVILGAVFIFNLQESESLFNFLLMWLAPIASLIGHIIFTSSILYQRVTEGLL